MEFHADDWFNITGRGPVAVIKDHDRKKHSQKKKLVGRVVIIDNVRYLVKSFEDCLVKHDDWETGGEGNCSHPLSIQVQKCKNQPSKAGIRSGGAACECLCHRASSSMVHIAACCRTTP